MSSPSKELWDAKNISINMLGFDLGCGSSTGAGVALTTVNLANIGAWAFRGSVLPHSACTVMLRLAAVQGAVGGGGGGESKFIIFNKNSSLA